MRVLVSAATGDIGGRPAQRLVDSGHEVRCLTRARRRLSDQPCVQRAEVGRIPAGAETPAVVCRAAVIVGIASASFEMLRHRTERLPAMVRPHWVESWLQPVAVRDVLRYLEGALALDPSTNRTFDVAGPDILTYEEMLQRFAAGAGLRPRAIARCRSSRAASRRRRARRRAVVDGRPTRGAGGDRGCVSGCAPRCTCPTGPG